MDRKLTRLPRQPAQPSASANSAVWPVGLLVALCFTTLPLFLALSPGRPTLPNVRQMGIRVTVRHEDATRPSEPLDSPPATRDILLGGLLSPDIDENSCLSRYLSSLYRKPSPHSPSPYLVSRLRKYEALHRRCGPGALFYDKSLAQLASAHRSMGLVECNYLVWTPVGHLGDRMLSMASAFLYALLTHRVFLVDMTKDMAGLFCEPFPGASWELPPGFPVQNLTQLRRGSEHSYANLLRAKKIENGDPAVRSESLPSYAYVHLEHDYKQQDQLFFCDDDQTVLGKVNWLILRSNLYFAPVLFLVPHFEDELRWMFPATDTVFHHIGRYLLHPSNKVWKLITGYYTSYMDKFEEKIGLQITTLTWNPVSTEAYFKQIMACTSHKKILPEVDPEAASSEHEVTATTSKAVLVSSTQPEYAERLKSMYYEHTTVTGEAVSVLQSDAGTQPRKQKVLAEMFLQSYCDVLVVSGWSTVGYVGHSLAGVKPWLLMSPRDQTADRPPCVRTTSMEPCFHAAPSYDCRAKKDGDLGAVLQHVRHCEDVVDGLKLFD
ncbi:probable fucosyltransferase 7 [Phragmites australis]|uniref:probable fucosyltransferase 7 n=1 Tax=Phragmites australis TaxID=29695 RepID=UPI002D79FC76|nr:probable fucosyltransferase 7 [Phragmites australis]